MKCNHNWKEDEHFKQGKVIMFFGDIGNVNQETKVICSKCGEIDYIKKGELK
jgi:hypothetical protein